MHFAVYDLISPRFSSCPKPKNSKQTEYWRIIFFPSPLTDFSHKLFIPNIYQTQIWLYWSMMILLLQLGIRFKCVSKVFEKCPEIGWMKISRVLERASVKDLQALYNPLFIQSKLRWAILRHLALKLLYCSNNTKITAISTLQW